MTVPLYNLTDTWNAGATVFNAIQMNVTNTASAAGSRLLDLQVGGTSMFNVDPNGSVDIPGVTVTTSQPILDLAQTWNAGGVTFTGLKHNIINTASASASKLIDFGVGGTSYLSANGDGSVTINQVFGALTNNALIVQYQAGGSGHSINFSPFLDSIAINGTASANLTFAGLGASVGCSASKVVMIGDGTINANGWMQWGGQNSVASPVSANNTTVLATVTGLSVALQAGRKYAFDVYLSFTCTAAQGIRAAMVATGGLTATAIQYDGWIVDSGANGIKGNTQATALGTVVANAPLTGTAGVVRIRGMITVNVAGTLNVQFAQSVAAANNTTVAQGSHMLTHDMP